MARIEIQLLNNAKKYLCKRKLCCLKSYRGFNKQSDKICTDFYMEKRNTQMFLSTQKQCL